MIKVYPLLCGSVGTDETIIDATKSKNPYAYTGLFRKKHRIWLPVYSYLIQHPKGNIIIDTSWHTDVRTKNRRKHLSWKIDFACKAILPENQAVNERLDALNLKPSDINIVMFTHLDPDHASGAKLLIGAKHFYVQEDEINATRKHTLRYNPKMWEGIKLESIPMKETGIGPFQKSYDVFNDGTINFIDIRGHSKGTTGVLIKNNDKFIILTGDACYTLNNWMNSILQGLTVNKDDALKSIKWVGEMSKNPNCLGIYTAHDPNIDPKIIEL